MNGAPSFHVGIDRRCHVDTAEPAADQVGALLDLGRVLCARRESDCMDTLPRVHDQCQQSLAFDAAPIVRRRIVRRARQPIAALDWVPLGRLWLVAHVRTARSCFDQITKITAANVEPAGKLMLERVRAHLAAALHHLESRVVQIGTSEARPRPLTHEEWTRRLEALRAHIAVPDGAPDDFAA